MRTKSILLVCVFLAITFLILSFLLKSNYHRSIPIQTSGTNEINKVTYKFNVPLNAVIYESGNKLPLSVAEINKSNNIDTTWVVFDSNNSELFRWSEYMIWTINKQNNNLSLDNPEIVSSYVPQAFNFKKSEKLKLNEWEVIKNTYDINSLPEGQPTGKVGYAYGIHVPSSADDRYIVFVLNDMSSEDFEKNILSTLSYMNATVDEP